MNKNSLKKAFTLAELMIVITIIGIIVAILVPNVKQTGNDEALIKFKNTNNSLHNAIRELIISNKYYLPGDLGMTNKGVLVSDAKYFCHSLADLLKTKSTHCSDTGGSLDKSALASLSGVGNFEVEDGKSIQDYADCICDKHKDSGAEIVLKNGATIYTVNPGYHFGMKTETTDSTGQTRRVFNVCSTNKRYKYLCVDVDGIDVGEKPFGYALRVDGKLIAGSRAQAWLNANSISNIPSVGGIPSCEKIASISAQNDICIAEAEPLFIGGGETSGSTGASLTFTGGGSCAETTKSDGSGTKIICTATGNFISNATFTGDIYLIGGGGGSSFKFSQGGNGGQVVEIKNFEFKQNQEYTLTIGAGGNNGSGLSTGGGTTSLTGGGIGLSALGGKFGSCCHSGNTSLRYGGDVGSDDSQDKACITYDSSDLSSPTKCTVGGHIEALSLSHSGDEIKNKLMHGANGVKIDGLYYAGGGGGSAGSGAFGGIGGGGDGFYTSQGGKPGRPNTGGGGGGSGVDTSTGTGGPGGSGVMIVISDSYNGIQMNSSSSTLSFNGEGCEGNGTSTIICKSSGSIIPQNYAKGTVYVIGGGGAGGSRTGCGGDAGQVIKSRMNFIKGKTYSFDIGAGGTGGYGRKGYDGSQTTFDSLIALGGAGGGYTNCMWAGHGGGHTSCSVTDFGGTETNSCVVASYGIAGKYHNASLSYPLKGGAGVKINGICYAAGGGGAYMGSSTGKYMGGVCREGETSTAGNGTGGCATGGAGTPNTGSGGGGGGKIDNSCSGVGGNGGSGVVIIKIDETATPLAREQSNSGGGSSSSNKLEFASNSVCTEVTSSNYQQKFLCKSNGTITATSSKSATVYAVGGGGGGGEGGCGGGGGGIKSATVNFTSGTTYTISIGSGGGEASTGGTTKLTGTGVNLSAAGGTGGGEREFGCSIGQAGSGNTQGWGGNRQHNSTGQPGGSGMTIDGTYYGGGGGGGGYASTNGGSGSLGGGGAGGGGTNAGSAGTANTGGGGGGGSEVVIGSNFMGGGSGGSGIVIILVD